MAQKDLSEYGKEKERKLDVGSRVERRDTMVCILSDCTVAVQPKCRSVGFVLRNSGRGCGGNISACPADAFTSGSLNGETGEG